MRRFGVVAVLFACVAWALPVPAAAQAGLVLTWDNCVLADTDAGEPQPQYWKPFNCASPRVYRLYGSFKSPIDFTLQGMDVVIDLYFGDYFEHSSLPLNPFWHYEPSGCDAGGLDFSHTLTGAEACGALTSAWQGGGFGTTVLTFYVPDVDRPGHGRLLASIFRPPGQPLLLHSDTNYFAFQLTWVTALAGTCPGCTDEMQVVWTQAKLVGPDNSAISLLGPDGKWAFLLALINTDTVYFPDPTVTTTWGQIKALYRGERMAR